VLTLSLPDGELPLRAIRVEEAHTVLAAVARSPVFCTLPTAAYKKLLPFFQLGWTRGSTVLVREGDPPPALFMVISGAVIVGDVRRGAGACFGALTSHPGPCEATARTVDDALLAVLTPVQLRVLARALPELSLDD
jgi:CRP-like cAMP-binding protein